MFKTKFFTLGVLFLLCFNATLLTGTPTPDPTSEAFGVILETFPGDKHFYPRNLSTNKGNALLNGKVYGISGYEQLRVKLYKNNVLTNTYEQTLSYQGNIASFNFNIAINAELSNYKFVLIGVDNGVETIEATADEVVAGDVYVINGQSNAVAAASIHPSDLSTFIRSYTNANGWNYINLSFPGQWGGRLAKRILDEEGIPVAIFNDAQGAQQIGYFLKNDTSPSSGNYGAQKTRLTNAGVAAQARAMIWFQGEADSYNVSTADYKADFQDLFNDWNVDYNFEEVYIFQTRYGACGSGSATIVEAHRQLAKELPGLHIMSSTNATYDGCHFPYENGYQVLGDRIYGLVNRDMYAGSSTNVAAPDVSNITVLDDQITIQMNGTNALSEIGTPWADFKLVGGNVTITGGSVSGNNILLNLSGAAAGVTGVSYLGHLDNANNWIVNPNNVSILSFANVPISNPIPGGGGTGGTVDCANIGITATSSGITISGLDGAPITQVQIFNTSWATAFQCAGNCNATENISLTAGQYYVYVKYFNSNWTPVCQINETITVAGGPVVDNDNDGVAADQDCDDNDPNIPTTPGNTCDDNNAATTNDVIQSDGCTCAGTTTTGGGGGGTGGTVDCANISVTATSSGITVSGLDGAPITQVQIFNTSWATAFNCAGNCNATENISLGAGQYYVYVKYFTSNWAPVCQIEETITVAGGPVVDNDNDGVAADQDCDDNDPNIPTTPGNTCDDNNAATTNDVIQSDGCTCAGTTTTTGGGGGTGGAIDCANILLSSTGTTLTISGLDSAPISKVQVLNQSWSIVFSCFGDCNGTETMDLPAGVYRIKAALNTSNWQQVCEIFEEVTLEDGGSTGGGTGGGNTGGNTGGGTGGGGSTNNVDLELAMTVEETEFFIYEYINYTLTLTNNGADAAGNVEVKDNLPAGTVYSSHVATNGGDYSSWNGIWNVGDLGAGETAVLQLRLFVLSNGEPINNFAQVNSATGTDADSTPGNNNSSIPSEDDEASVSLEAGVREANSIGIALDQNRFLVLTNLYPNPVNDQLNLQVMANESTTQQIAIYDSFGSLKQSFEWGMEEGLNNIKLNVDELATGMYYILFETNNGHEPIRFVKQRL